MFESFKRVALPLGLAAFCGPSLACVDQEDGSSPGSAAVESVARTSFDLGTLLNGSDERGFVVPWEGSDRSVTLGYADNGDYLLCLYYDDVDQPHELMCYQYDLDGIWVGSAKLHLTWDVDGTMNSKSSWPSEDSGHWLVDQLPGL